MVALGLKPNPEPRTFKQQFFPLFGGFLDRLGLRLPTVDDQPSEFSPCILWQDVVHVGRWVTARYPALLVAAVIESVRHASPPANALIRRRKPPIGYRGQGRIAER